MIADHGLVVAELDPAWWWTPGAAGFSIPAELDPVDVFRHGEAELFRIAEVLGARSLNVADALGGRWSVDEGASAFAALCDRAAEHGLLVHLEWLAWSRVPDLATAWEIVRWADRPNGGLNVDMWHCARTGTTPEDLLAIPGERILAVQVDDGPALAEDDLVEATLHHRLVPGAGEFDLVGYLVALRTIAAVGPIGVEVFSDDLHALGSDGGGPTGRGRHPRRARPDRTGADLIGAVGGGRARLPIERPEGATRSRRHVERRPGVRSRWVVLAHGQSTGYPPSPLVPRAPQSEWAWTALAVDGGGVQHSTGGQP